MNAPDWARIEELFHRARALAAPERAQALRSWCANDPTIEAEVLSLLAADAEVERLMSNAPVADTGGVLIRDGADPWIGARLGPYTLERLLGRGGMGAVYLGYRDTGSARQAVAIKVIARHLASSPALHQFLAERDALARVEHRHVARLIDAGMEGGNPYVVMEYVDGRPLNEFCDDPGVALQTRLRLFLQVCDAVAHVHGHLILHRDLKPGNVLVTAEGNAKLLDFGAIKRIDIEAADSMLTRAGLRPLTLNYASPEHIRGEVVSTATDVYSLGVLLYRLLSGRLPHDSGGKALSQFLAGVEHETPPSPTRDIAAPAHLRADLDAIVEMALRFDPGSRYSSAEALAADVHKALQNKPVSAHTGRWTHRAVKYCARHRGAILATGSMLVALTAALATLWHEAGTARREAARAQTGIETERSLTHLLLFDYFDSLKQIPGSTRAQQQALLRAVQYIDTLGQVLPSAAWLPDQVAAYTRLGSLLGDPYEENVGDTPHAIGTLQKAVALAQELVARHPDDPAALQTAAAAQQALGRVYFGNGDPQHAEPYLTQAAAISERLAGSPGIDAATLAQAASVVEMLGDLHGLDGAVILDDPVASMAAYHKAQDLDARGLALGAGCNRCRRGVALQDWKMGQLTEATDLNRALEIYRHGLDTVAQFPAAERASAKTLRLDTLLRQQSGSALVASGATREGITLLRQVHERLTAAAANDPLDTRARFDLAALDTFLADAYGAANDDAGERAATREYSEIMNLLVSRDGGNDAWRYHRADATIRYALALARPVPTPESRKLLQQGLDDIVRQAKAPDATTNVLHTACNALLDAGQQPALALELAERTVKSLRPPSPEALLTLARAQRAMGQLPQSAATAKQVLSLLAQHPAGRSSRENLKPAQTLARNQARLTGRT